MTNTKTDKIEQVIKSIRENEQAKLVLEKELKKKTQRLKVAQDRSNTTLIALNDLQTKYDAEVEIDIIEFSPEYYELKNTIKTLKEKGQSFIKDIKLLNTLSHSYTHVLYDKPEHSFSSGERDAFTRSQINKILSNQKVHQDLITSLETQIAQMRILILTELDEVEFLNQKPGLKKLAQNIEITHKILTDSIIQVKNLENEIGKIKSEINDLEDETSALEFEIKKITEED